MAARTGAFLSRMRGRGQRSGARPRARCRWLTAIAGFAVLAGFALWAYARRSAVLDTEDTYVAGVPHARSTLEPAGGVARRVVFVVVEGLGYDDAVDLESLAPLAAEGAIRPLGGNPTPYSAPSVTAMMTGLAPRESGVRLTGARSARGIDDVLSSAWDGGVYVRVRAGDDLRFLALARPPPRADARAGELRLLADMAEWSLEPAPTETAGRAVEIVVVRVGDLEEALRAHGAGSPEFREAGLHVGALLQAMAARLDPGRDVLVAASDHGPRALHGCGEASAARAFVLAWGHRVKRGATLPPRRTRDVAPTLAAMMGVHAPSSNMGAPMLDLFDATEPERAALLDEPIDEATRFDCALLAVDACRTVERARERLRAGDVAAGEGALAAIDEQIEAARRAAAARAAATRAAVAGLLAIALLLAASFGAPRRPPKLLVPFAAWGPYVALLAAAGRSLSASSLLPPRTFAFETVAAAALALAALVFVARRHALDARDAAWLLATTSAVAMVASAWAGATGRDGAPPIAAALAVQMLPLVAVAVVGAWAILLAGPRRTRAKRAKPPVRWPAIEAARDQ
jgi:hypothetical protein